MCLETERIVKSYEAYIEKEEDLSPRQRILSLIMRKGVPLINFKKNLSDNAEQAKAALDEGRLPFEVYEFLTSVKERVERRLNETKEEGNILYPSLGDKLEGIWDRLQAHLKPALLLEGAIDAYSEAKKEDKIPAQQKLQLLVEKRVQPALKIDREAREAAEAAGPEVDEVDLEVLMAIRERVEEELADAREEGFALCGPDVDVVEKEEEKNDKRRRGSSSGGAAGKGGADASKSSKERLKEKAEQRKVSESGAEGGASASGGGGNEEDLARKVAEAERIAAELLAEESKSGAGKGSKSGADTSTSGSGAGGAKKKKTPKA